MTAARDYFASRAIDPQVAFDCGVRPGRNANELLFPNGRRRILDEGKVLQAKGRPLEAWWLLASLPKDVPVAPPIALVCEGESDSLAARSALNGVPDVTGLRYLTVVCVPGTGFPLARLIKPLLLGGFEQVLLASDPDPAGERFCANVISVSLDAGIHPVRVEVPEPDLAGWLVTLDAAERGERFASLLIDSELAAPTRDELLRRREAEALRAKADALEAAA